MSNEGNKSIQGNVSKAASVIKESNVGKESNVSKGSNVGKGSNTAKAGMEAFYQQLQSLQEIDFVLVELNLYLDTHPQDIQAIEQYNHMVQKRWQLAQEFEHSYGPLMNFGHSYSRHPWQWIDTPWPWQV